MMVDWDVDENMEEKRLAEIAGWALCKHSGGGGPGKCDLMACACGPEGIAVAKAIVRALSLSAPYPDAERAPQAGDGQPAGK